MERLTKKSGDMAWYKAESLPLEPCEMTGSQVGKVLRRLAVYEDTGLDPQEIEALKLYAMGAGIAQIKEFDGIPVEILRKLAQGTKEDRVVVLPCPIGSTVYIIGAKYRHGRTDSWINTGTFRWSDVEKLGVTVFLTHEEAVEALEKNLQTLLEARL